MDLNQMKTKYLKIAIYLLKDFSIKGANSTHWHRSLPVTTGALVLLIVCDTASRRMDRPEHKLLSHFFSFEEIGKIFQVYGYTNFRFILTCIYWYLTGKEILETNHDLKYPIYEGMSSLYHNSSVRSETLYPNPQLLSNSKHWIVTLKNAENILRIFCKIFSAQV